MINEKAYEILGGAYPVYKDNGEYDELMYEACAVREDGFKCTITWKIDCYDDNEYYGEIWLDDTNNAFDWSFPVAITGRA